MGRERTLVAINVGIRGIAAPDATMAVHQLDATVGMAADRADVRSQGGWGWTTDWGPTWDSPDVLIVDYCGYDGEARHYG